MTQKTFYHLHFITSSMFYGMCFTLRYYNLSELSQALKQTLQVGSGLVISPQAELHGTHGGSE